MQSTASACTHGNLNLEKLSKLPKVLEVEGYTFIATVVILEENEVFVEIRRPLVMPIKFRIFSV